MSLMSMHTDTYNSRFLTSSQKKPSAGAILKTYANANRPNSALRTKYEPESNTQSPTRNDSKTPKKVQMSRYPSTSNSTKPYDIRSQEFRRKNEESITSMSLSRSNKWDKNLSIETSSAPINYSGLNLKGYSVTQTHSQISQKPPSAGIVPLTSKYSSYNYNSYEGSYAYANRGNTPSSSTKTPPFKQYATNRGYTLTSSTPTSTMNERILSSENPSKIDIRAMQSSIYSSPSRPTPYGEEPVYLPPFEPTKCSTKSNGVIKAYGVNTHQGIVRNYNEDRVAIILNIAKPAHLSASEEWPVCSFFGVYDGHGGTTCADFLRDNLHQYVIQDKNFPKNPIEALKKGFEEAERVFKEIAQQNPRGEIDRSGSCAIVSLIVGIFLY